MSRAVLVTGATGFVGGAVLERLAAGADPVVALVRGYRTDLPAAVIQRIAGPIETLDRDGWLSALEGIGTVIHLAAIAHIGPSVGEERYDAVNHRAVAGLCEAARIAGVGRIVLMSSIRAQCGAGDPAIQTEASPARPSDAYGRAKLAAERALAASGVPFVILRPVLVVGDPPKGNLRLLARLAATPLPLPFASLTARRSMISREELAAIAVRAVDDPAMSGRVFVCADPQPLTLAETLAALRRGMGRKARLFAVPAGLFRLAFRLIGRPDLWQRIGDPLVARPDGLTAIGYRFVAPVRASLERMLRRS